jgi:hypothetical protein
VCVNAGVITGRDPDSVRGSDLSFYSFPTMPKGRVPLGAPDVPPELVVEVLSQHDRWP